MPTDAAGIDNVHLAAPREIGGRPQLYAWESCWKVFGLDLAPVAVEVIHLDRDHLVFLPLGHIDALEHEIRHVPSQAGEPIVLPGGLEAELSEKGQRQPEIRPGRHER